VPVSVHNRVRPIKCWRPILSATGLLILILILILMTILEDG